MTLLASTNLHVLFHDTTRTPGLLEYLIMFLFLAAAVAALYFALRIPRLPAHQRPRRTEGQPLSGER